MASVVFDKTTRVYPGTERPAVDALDLEIPDGEFLVLVGPSAAASRQRFGCSPASRTSTAGRFASATGM
jgi:ABC-type taurine transport system ATPase subunit